MSIQARQKLVDSPNTIFQNDSQRGDFLNPNIVKTEVVALILEIIGKGHFLEFTAVCSDHHDDSCLGPHSHKSGDAFDCWPLVSARAGDYADASSPEMLSFVADLFASPWLYQGGLGGSSQTEEIIRAAGYQDYSPPRLFEDGPQDHIHAGCKFPGDS